MLVVGTKLLNFVMDDDIHNEARAHALDSTFDDIPYKVFTPEYLFCNALSEYRNIDIMKLFRSADEVEPHEEYIYNIVEKFNLGNKLQDREIRSRNTVRSLN